jgi:hypothetical protein
MESISAAQISSHRGNTASDFHIPVSRCLFFASFIASEIHANACPRVTSSR